MSPPFRVYYDNGATFTGPPQETPALGVIAVVQPDPDHGRMLLARWDYYCWHPDPGQWWGHDLFGLWDYLIQPGWRRVLFGRNVTQEVFHQILRRAEADPDFPVRSATSKREAAVMR